MIHSWPWGNYWEEPNWELMEHPQPLDLVVEPHEPSEDPVLYGPDGQPIPTRPAIPIGFQLPHQEAL